MYYVIFFEQGKISDISEWEEEQDVINGIKGFNIVENSGDISTEPCVLIIEGEAKTIGLRDV